MDTTVVDVVFGGDADSREGPLTWGQAAILEVMRASTATFNLPYLVPLADLSATVGAVAEALARLLSRHEALRTGVRLADETARQVVPASGVLRVPVVRCAAADVDEVCGRIAAAQWREPFDLAGLPLRVSLVESAGLVRAAVFTYCHVAVDGAAMRLVEADLRSLLSTGGFAGEPAPSPLDIAAFERGDGVDVDGRAMRYWAGELRRIPVRTLAPAGPAHEPRGQQAKLQSYAVAVAGGRLAAAHRTTVSTVVLAATVWSLAQRTGQAPTAVNLLWGNRTRPGYRDVVGNLAQTGLFVLDVPAGSGVGDLVAPTGRAAFQAYRHAYYDHTSLARVRRAVAGERGVEPNPYCCFNFDAEPAGPPDAGADPRDLLPRTTLDWSPEPPQFRCQFCLKVAVGTDGLASLVLTADTACLPPDEIAGFLRGLERVLVEAACGAGSGAGHR